MIKYYSEAHGATLFADDELKPLLLPCFFSHALHRNAHVYKAVDSSDGRGFVSRSLAEKDVSPSTIKIILQRLSTFLCWVEDYSKTSKHVTLATHHNLPDRLINYYVADVLIGERGASLLSVQQHLMALNAYYNYLAKVGFAQIKRIYVSSNAKQKARQQQKIRTAVKYLTPELRSIIYRNTKSIRDELLLRTGGELGLRSKENLGLLVNDFHVGGKKHLGLMSLFKKMDNDPDRDVFEYFLQGIYTKGVRFQGGRSRTIYIHRSLLQRMREYFETERPMTEHNSFFVNNSPSEIGSPIDEGRASRIFKEARDEVLAKQEAGLLPVEGQMLEKDHTGHVLRHSYGTDKFYEYASDNGMAVDNVTPTSQVYLTVARLLGHNAADGKAPVTTRSYIRSCHIKMQYEGLV
ncbi:site-specific integrase [Microbulbifer sp. HZ11]|uniref:tyrosine-type recombinase/integrase n=1 Tax=Microbulbifer sp. HZ11 TaxID=1453501 RepID=UPI0005B95C7C|nr:site-specific integrase [Microbulbifer sp. HZ11]